MRPLATGAVATCLMYRMTLLQLLVIFFRRVRVEGDMKKARRVLQCV